MNNKWINKEGNKKCILFFNGWGMDENAVKHLRVDDYDICMFNNYSSLNIEDELFNYTETYIIAWSLGVWVANRILNTTGLSIQKSIAINGTLNPIHDTLGIPENIFGTTLTNWNERNRNKFNMRVLGGKKLYAEFSREVSLRDVDEQKTELAFIQDSVQTVPSGPNQFDRVLIGKNDLIFSHENQINFWKDQASTTVKDIPHFPFGEFVSWKEIIEQ